MKKLINNSIILAIILLLSAPSNTIFAENIQEKVTTTKKDSTQNKVVCYEVFGMDCPGCQSALEKQVKKIDGVADAKANFKEKQVIIELKPDTKVSDEEIEKRIKKANFTPGKKIEPSKDEE